MYFFNFCHELLNEILNTAGVYHLNVQYIYLSVLFVIVHVIFFV